MGASLRAVPWLSGKGTPLQPTLISSLTCSHLSSTSDHHFHHVGPESFQLCPQGAGRKNLDSNGKRTSEDSRSLPSAQLKDKHTQLTISSHPGNHQAGGPWESCLAHSLFSLLLKQRQQDTPWDVPSRNWGWSPWCGF